MLRKAPTQHVSYNILICLQLIPVSNHVGMVRNKSTEALHLPTAAIGDGGGKNDLRTHLAGPCRSEEHGMLTVSHPATKATTATDIQNSQTKSQNVDIKSHHLHLIRISRIFSLKPETMKKSSNQPTSPWQLEELGHIY